MENAFSSFFYDVFMGKIHSMKEALSSFMNTLQSAIARIASQKLAEGIISWAGGFFSGIFKKHEGGYIPKFHIGGLASDEIPAILQKGEYVIRKSAVDQIGRENLERLNKGDTSVIERIQKIETNNFQEAKISKDKIVEKIIGKELFREISNFKEKYNSFKENISHSQTIEKIKEFFTKEIHMPFIPRFHIGGLASDEVPAILQKGEYVIRRSAVELLDRVNQGDLSVFEGGESKVEQYQPVVLNMSINTTDPITFETYIKRNKGAIQKMIIRDILNNGQLIHAIREAY